MPEIFNTDQGCWFTSAPFIGVLEAHEVRISMCQTPRHECCDDKPVVCKLTINYHETLAWFDLANGEKLSAVPFEDPLGISDRLEHLEFEACKLGMFLGDVRPPLACSIVPVPGGGGVPVKAGIVAAYGIIVV